NMPARPIGWSASPAGSGSPTMPSPGSRPRRADMPIVGFDELQATVPAGRLMALDVGSKTIGLATSDALRMLATPLETLRRGKLAADLARLAELARRHEIAALVVGLPLNMDGSEGPRCQSVRQFVANIARHAPPALASLPVVLQDERLSTA